MALLKDVTSSEFLVSIRLSEIPERNFMTKYLEYLIATIDTNVSS